MIAYLGQSLVNSATTLNVCVLCFFAILLSGLSVVSEKTEDKTIHKPLKKKRKKVFDKNDTLYEYRYTINSRELYFPSYHL